jgi:hypothetical protein
MQFSEVLAGGARTLVRGAQAALRVLPGSPLMAVAIRGGGSGVPSSTTLSSPLAPSLSPTLAGANGSPEGPGGASLNATPGGPEGGVGGASDGIEGALAQEQQMSLYYLQIQEQVNAENRTFSALSNVLEVEHNTAKTAIGNIH